MIPGLHDASPAHRRHRAATAGLVVLYLATRLSALTTLPIFFDETGHIRWSMLIAQGERWGRPWQYGKGLPIFANALVFPWARDEYLWASRAVTVLFGLGTLLGAMALARRLGGPRAGLFAGVLYVACPFALFYDRLVLTDPALGTFAVFVALFGLGMAEEGKTRDGLRLGLVLALAVLSKALGVLLFFATLAAVLLAAPRRRRPPGALLLAYAVAAALTAYPLVRFFRVTSTVRVAVQGEVSYLARLAENVPVGAAWLWTYWTAPLVLLALAGLAAAVVRRSGAVAFVATMVAVPFLAIAAVSELWFPRYLVFLTGPFVAVAAYGAEALVALLRSRVPVRAHWAAAGGAALLALAPAMWVDFDLLRDPSRAALPPLDHIQFVTGWPSGYGVRDTVELARAERARRPEGLVVVSHSRTVRTTARALDLEFAGDPDVRVEDLNFDALEGALPLLAEWAREKPTLVVIEPVRASSRRPPPETFAPFGGRLLARTFKPNGDLCDEVYLLARDSGSVDVEVPRP
jgi:hypothetical protein